jgi:hypothetical protein
MERGKTEALLPFFRLWITLFSKDFLKAYNYFHMKKIALVVLFTLLLSFGFFGITNSVGA